MTKAETLYNKYSRHVLADEPAIIDFAKLNDVDLIVKDAGHYWCIFDDLSFIYIDHSKCLKDHSVMTNTNLDDYIKHCKSTSITILYEKQTTKVQLSSTIKSGPCRWCGGSKKIPAFRFGEFYECLECK